MRHRSILVTRFAFLLATILMTVTASHGFFQVFQDDQAAQKVFASDVEIQRDLLKHIMAEAESYTEQTKEFTTSSQQRLDDNEEQTAYTERKQQEEEHPVGQEFLVQKITLLKEIRQILLSTRMVRKDIISVLEQHKKLLEGYLKDPQFNTFKLEQQSFYTTDQLEKASKNLFDQDIRIKRLADQKEDMIAELESRKKELAALKKEYEEKHKAQQEFEAKTIVPLGGRIDKGFTVKQRGQLLDLEVALLGVRIDLAELKEKQSKAKNNLLGTQLFFEKQKQRVLKDNFVAVKAKLRVDEADIEQEEQELAAVKHDTQIQTERYFKKISQLSAIREQIKQTLEELPEAAVDVSAQVDWGIDAETPQAYQKTAYINYLHEQFLTYDRNIELLNVQLELENAKKKHQEFALDVTRSWYQVSRGLLRDSDSLADEIKKYKDIITQQERSITSLVEKRKAASELLSVQNSSLETIKKEIKHLSEQKDTFFAGAHGAFMQSQSYILNAHAMLEQEIAANRARIEAYSTMITYAGQMIKNAKMLLEDLEIKSIWQRSEYAITAEGISNLIPDIKMFVLDLPLLGKDYMQQLSIKNMVRWITESFTLGGALFLLLLLLAAAWLLMLLKQQILPWLQTLLLQSKPAYRITFVINRLAAALVGFLTEHVLGISIWCFVLFLIQAQVITHAFPRILFYLVSIAYWLHLARGLMRYVQSFNAAHDYKIFSPEFERRVMYIFSLLAYVTIVILFFRQAFMIASIRPSQTPRILLAIYSIGARLLIPVLLFQLFSIGKKEIIDLLPEKGAFWQFLADKLNRYYYVLLTGIILLMILSDPYVGGYGNLVSYALKGFIGTFLLLWALTVLHSWGKQLTSRIFFIEEDDTFKERFSAAKTWFGLFTILLFVALGIVGIVIGLKIWGTPVTFEDIYNLHKWKMFPVYKDGAPEPFTLFDFLSLIGIIIGGFIFAAGINRFVLRRIFSIIPVDLGIQNTVMSITRYVIILIVFLGAFMWAELGSMLLTIGIVIGSITYVFKEPLADFFSYFIILVQRPIQIGDYVLFTDEVQGVVRRITPRSIILRRKNSYSIIVPNSTVVKDSISNWNYARNFVAFDDIEFTVPYTAQPEKVKKIVLEVLDKNLTVLKSPAPIVRLVNFGEYGFEFMVRGFVTDTNILNKWDIASDVRFAIVTALREHKVKIAIPTRMIISDEPSPAKPQPKSD